MCERLFSLAVLLCARCQLVWKAVSNYKHWGNCCNRHAALVTCLCKAFYISTFRQWVVKPAFIWKHFTGTSSLMSKTDCQRLEMTRNYLYVDYCTFQRGTKNASWCLYINRNILEDLRKNRNHNLWGLKPMLAKCHVLLSEASVKQHNAKVSVPSDDTLFALICLEPRFKQRFTFYCFLTWHQVNKSPFVNLSNNCT